MLDTLLQLHPKAMCAYPQRIQRNAELGCQSATRFDASAFVLLVVLDDHLEVLRRQTAQTVLQAFPAGLIRYSCRPLCD